MFVELFIEIQNQGRAHQKELNDSLALVARDVGVGLVGTNDVHYLREDDAYAHEVLRCVGTNSTMNSPDRMRMEGKYHLRPPEEMIAAFEDHPEPERRRRLVRLWLRNSGRPFYNG